MNSIDFHRQTQLIVFTKVVFAFACLIGVWEGAQIQAAPAVFTGVYFQNFDSALTNETTNMPGGFRAMILAGANNTYTASTPITPAAIASATPSGVQNLSAWDFGNAVASSGASLFNVGSMANLADRALGSDPSGIGAMVIELSLTNATGSTLAGVTFSYDLIVLTNGSAGTEAGELPGTHFFTALPAARLRRNGRV